MDVQPLNGIEWLLEWIHVNSMTLSDNEEAQWVAEWRWIDFNILGPRKRLPPFCRRYIQYENFRIKKNLWICSFGFIWQDLSIGSDNCLAPNSWQAIIWTYMLVYFIDTYYVYASLGLNELNFVLFREYQTIWLLASSFSLLLCL